MGVADAQAQQHPVAALVVEALGAGQQQLADAIERIDLAAPVAERLVLDPATDLVQAPVADPHDMERVGDAGGVVESGRQPGSERLGQIGGHHLDAGDQFRSALLVHRRRSAAALPFTMSMSTLAWRSTRPVA